MSAYSQGPDDSDRGAPDRPPKPWDQRIARWCVGPLAHTPVSPNHLTTLGLLAGLAAGWCYAEGGGLVHWGAALFVLAAWLDHADGELARLSARVSKFGHYYDNVAGVVTYIVLFCGMGIGLRDTEALLLVPAQWAPLLGITAGVAIAVIFAVRVALEDRAGRSAVAQPSAAGFEIEDIMYLVAPVTWLGWHGIFLSLAGIGAPLYMVWQLRQARRAAAGRS